MHKHCPRQALALGLISGLSTFAAARDEPAITRSAVCRWTQSPPKLDGKLEDAAWKDAAPIEAFAASWKQSGDSPATRAFLLWDNNALYFAARMSDTELRAFGTKRNDHLWQGDVFELFFKPSAARPEYYEFQGNPRGVVFEAAWPERGSDFNRATAGPPLGVELAAQIEGTLDKPGDTDQSWTIEGRIPWTAFRMTGGRPKSGAEWLFALCRYDYGPAGTEPVLQSSAPLTRPRFHRYEDYGKLHFEGPRSKSREKSRSNPVPRPATRRFEPVRDNALRTE